MITLGAETESSVDWLIYGCGGTGLFAMGYLVYYVIKSTIEAGGPNLDKQAKQMLRADKREIAQIDGEFANIGYELTRGATIKELDNERVKQLKDRRNFLTNTYNSSKKSTK